MLIIDFCLLNVTGATWACVGVASERFLRYDKRNKAEKQSGSTWKNPTRGRRRKGRPESADAGAVGDVRLAPASRLG